MQAYRRRYITLARLKRAHLASGIDPRSVDYLPDVLRAKKDLWDAAKMLHDTLEPIKDLLRLYS